MWKGIPPDFVDRRLPEDVGLDVGVGSSPIESRSPTAVFQASQESASASKRKRSKRIELGEEADEIPRLDVLHKKAMMTLLAEKTRGERAKRGRELFQLALQLEKEGTTDESGIYKIHCDSNFRSEHGPTFKIQGHGALVG